MPFFIQDDRTAEPMAELAKPWGTTKQDTVRSTVEAELRCVMRKPLPRDRFARCHAENPFPQPTGKPADNAFLDDLSGDPG